MNLFLYTTHNFASSKNEFIYTAGSPIWDFMCGIVNFRGINYTFIIAKRIIFIQCYLLTTSNQLSSALFTTFCLNKLFVDT